MILLLVRLVQRVQEIKNAPNSNEFMNEKYFDGCAQKFLQNCKVRIFTRKLEKFQLFDKQNKVCIKILGYYLYVLRSHDVND